MAIRKYAVLQNRPNGLPMIKHSYEGFNKRLKDATHIVLILVEGEIEIYAIEPKLEAEIEFKRYLEDHYSDLNFEYLGIFKKDISNVTI